MMPSKKRKYNARFPAGRIKKIMQTDEEVGKVAQAVPVIISRTLELFVESLLTKSMQITLARNAKTLTPSHMKQCILSESRFDFLKDLVKDIPDASVQEDNDNNAIYEESLEQNAEAELEMPCQSKGKQSNLSVKETLKNKIQGDSQGVHSRKRHATSNVLSPLVPPLAVNFFDEQSTSTSRTPVIKYGPNITQTDSTKFNYTVNSLIGQNTDEPQVHVKVEPEATSQVSSTVTSTVVISDNVPPLIPLSHTSGTSSGDNLTIDEDYDN